MRPRQGTPSLGSPQPRRDAKGAGLRPQTLRKDRSPGNSEHRAQGTGLPLPPRRDGTGCHAEPSPATLAPHSLYEEPVPGLKEGVGAHSLRRQTSRRLSCVRRRPPRVHSQDDRCTHGTGSGSVACGWWVEAGTEADPRAAASQASAQHSASGLGEGGQSRQADDPRPVLPPSPGGSLTRRRKNELRTRVLCGSAAMTAQDEATRWEKGQSRGQTCLVSTFSEEGTTLYFPPPLPPLSETTAAGVCDSARRNSSQQEGAPHRADLPAAACPRWAGAFGRVPNTLRAWGQDGPACGAGCVQSRMRAGSCPRAAPAVRSPAHTGRGAPSREGAVQACANSDAAFLCPPRVPGSSPSLHYQDWFPIRHLNKRMRGNLAYKYYRNQKPPLPSSLSSYSPR